MEATCIIIEDGYHDGTPTIYLALEDGGLVRAQYTNLQCGRRYVSFFAAPSHNGLGLEWHIKERDNGDRAAGIAPSNKETFIFVPWGTPVDDRRTTEESPC